MAQNKIASVQLHVIFFKTTATVAENHQFQNQFLSYFYVNKCRKKMATSNCMSFCSKTTATVAENHQFHNTFWIFRINSGILESILGVSELIL